MQLYTGRLTRDVELKDYVNAEGKPGKYTGNALAIDTGEKDRDGNKLTTFLQFSLFGKNAEAFANTFQKGDRAHLAGEIVPHSFERKGGVQVESVELKVRACLNENQADRINRQIRDAVFPSKSAEQQHEENHEDENEAEPF
ncbi:hypothetical protein FACS189425_05820 [Clostridia bacterium]|nr:hypothetical protein FACS189425_05820 [Clostridia bacterium]